MIDGEPGIGKTTLLRELLGIAQDRGFAVLSCRPSRSELDLSYAGLVELLGGVAGDVLDALPAPQARVLKVLLRREEPGAAFDRLSLGLATVAAVRAVAVARPVLVAVDDVRWLDHPSAETVAFLARRLAGTPTRIVVVRSGGGWPAGPGRGGDRPVPGEAVDWRTELARAMPEGRLDTVRVGPVPAGDLSRILRRALGWAPAWPRLLRIAELSGGNPLYALELARASGGVPPGGDAHGPLRDSVLDLAQSRIARLPARVRRAVELASVPRAPTLDLLRRLDPAALDLADALGTAIRRGILTLDGERIRFAHPILAAAAYASIPAERGRVLHRAVAVLAEDLEERARHLATAATGPDPEVAVALEAAAEQAWRRGAPDAAADLLRLACKLTGAEDTEALATRRVAYGRLLHSAGDTPGAIAELTALVDSLPAGLVRATALYHLLYITRTAGSLGRALEYGRQAAAEAADDPSLQAQVFEMLSRLSDGDIPFKLSAARRALVAVDRIAQPDPDVVFYARAALVEAEFYAGLGIHLERLAGLDPGTRTRFPPVRTASRADDLFGRLLTYAGRIDEGLAVLRGLYDRASVEARAILSGVLSWMAEGEIMAGRFAAAAELTAEAIERDEESGALGGTPWVVGFHGVALAMLGRLDEAERAGAGVVAAAQADAGVGLDEAPARLALGLAALARDRFADAAGHLRRLDGMKRDAGIGEPRYCAHASELVEALVGLGELAEAGVVLAPFEDEAATSGGQWSVAAAARCRALLLAAEGDLDGAVAAVRRSLSLFDGLPLAFERARTLFTVGQIHRRRREKGLARRALADALAAFEDLGTPVWAGRARAELARVPVRRPADGHDPSGLTPTEERIARLAVEGLTNREIADRTFLSPKTVEVNLTRVYRKLGVRSRAVLASRLAGERDG